jgi:hypothetical protein
VGAQRAILKAGIVAAGWVRQVKLDLVDKRKVPN